MIYALSVFASAVFISLTAAYFSVIGLATMFPGSATSVVVMGVALELGKLMGAVWLHQNWNLLGRVIRYYLLGAVFVLIGITSMGIFGYLSQAHIEHESIVGQERSRLEVISQKITRLDDNIDRQERYIDKIESKTTQKSENASVVIKTLQDRILQINNEAGESIKTEEGVIQNLDSRLTVLDEAKRVIIEKGGFGTSGKLKDLAAQQMSERESIKQSRGEALERIQSHRQEASAQLSAIREKIDSLQGQGAPAEENTDTLEGHYTAIDDFHEQISTLNLERIEYEKKIKLIEAEVGPVKYIAAMIEDVGGSSLPTDQMIRVVIIILIFVFDPLAIILLIASAISINHYKKKSLPPDVKAIRDHLLDEIEEYVANGGLVEHFIERARGDAPLVSVSIPTVRAPSPAPPPTPSPTPESAGDQEIHWPNAVL